MRLKVWSTATAVLVASAMVATGCSLEVKETPDHDQGTIIIGPTPEPLPYSAVRVTHLERKASQCEVDSTSYYYHGKYGTYFSGTSYKCYENPDYRWQTSCPSENCNPLQVYAHYMLSEELGDGLTVHIEAFDNKAFSGYPRGTVEITDFRARSGEWDKAELFLPPGEYYVRAFVKNVDEDPTPYNFDGMELVAGEPVGVFGALSGPEKVIIGSYANNDPVHIKLDKLFRKPGSEPDTKAYLRLKMSTERHDLLQTGRKVYVELFASDDFGATPVHKFEMASELLKIEGQVGTAEFVSPSLTVGQYIVRVYLDSDNNGFHDDHELGAVHMAMGEPRLVRIERNRIETLSLILSTPERL